MNIVLYESVNRRAATAGKARVDAREILLDMGYEGVVLFHNGRAKPIILLEIIVGCLRTVAKADKEDSVFFQYPYYSKFVHGVIFGLLSFGKRLKGYKVCILIHDVMAMRSEEWMTEKRMRALCSEVKTWRWVDRVICHSENMRAVFRKANDFDRYSVLGPFDYLYNGPTCKRIYSPQPTVMFAGNLNKPKCGFVYKLPEIDGVRFDLFGPRYTGGQTKNIHHRGIFSSDELVTHLDGQFGLVWDGDSIETCSGYFGEYLKYNSPHKFSLYLAAGVPVIVWKESALAEYVEKKCIGIIVRDLRELKKVLNGLHEQEYNKMVENVMRVRKDIIQGRQLKNAID